MKADHPKHLIFGTGLTGGYLAGAFLSQKLNVTLLGRKKSQDAMANGLQVSDYLGHAANLPTPVFVDGQQAQESRFDIIWVAVKCTSIAAAIEELRQILNPETTLICCQNGLGSEKILQDAFPHNRILKAIVGYNVAEPGPGHYHRSTEGRLVLEDCELSQQLCLQLDCDLLPTTIANDISSEQWAKLQLNLTNPVNALSNIPIKVMLEQAGYRKIVAGLMRELLAVANANQMALPKITNVPPAWIPRIMALPDWLFKLVAQKMVAVDPTARLSMWWDLSSGRTTEIDYLNAAVVNEGNRLGVPCPLNEKIVQLVKQVESGELQIGLSADQLAQRLTEHD